MDEARDADPRVVYLIQLEELNASDSI